MSNSKTRVYTLEMPNGTKTTITYKEIREHNRDIIEDNIGYGLTHPGDWTEEEVDEYAKQAYYQNRKFLQTLSMSKNPVVVLDTETELYKLK